MMKEEATERVLVAVRRILAGQLYLSETMAARLLHLFVDGRPDHGTSPTDRLSDRELEVFQLIGNGLGNSQIAAKLHLSTKTIETYRAHIKEKLNLQDSTELLRAAIQWTQGMARGDKQCRSTPAHLILWVPCFRAVAKAWSSTCGEHAFATARKHGTRAG